MFGRYTVLLPIKLRVRKWARAPGKDVTFDTNSLKGDEQKTPRNRGFLLF